MCYASKRNIFKNTFPLFLLNLTIYVNILPPFFEILIKDEGNFMTNDWNFQLAFLDAFEALEYMYESQMGTAMIAETVERPSNIEEVRQCSGEEQFPHLPQSRKWTTSEDFYLFSAYLDLRFNELYSNYPIIRVIASAYGIIPQNTTYFCHFRLYKNERRWLGSVTKANIRLIWQRGWDPRNEFYNTFLISCPFLFKEKYKRRQNAVFVSKNSQCYTGNGNRNFTKIIETTKNSIMQRSLLGIKPDEIKIAVCIKGLTFLETSEFSSRWILEWLELQWDLGADSISIYNYWIPDKVNRLLDEIEGTRIPELIITNIELPGYFPNQAMTRHQLIARNKQQKRRSELVSYNDCFYRYSSSHHFILILDVDEAVVPLKHENWKIMLSHVLTGQWHAEPSSISIRNVYKFIGNRTEESIFENGLRSSIVQERDQYGKSFISSQSVVSVFNHFALHRLHGNVSKTHFVNENDALKLHWKRKCPYLELGDELCSKIVNRLQEDLSLKKFREKIEKAIKLYGFNLQLI